MRFKRFNEITFDYLKSDLHIHSTYTDGQDSIPSIVKQAEIMNIKTIAITDHIREDSKYFNKYVEEIEAIRKTTNLNILIGLEARIKNFRGEIDIGKKVSSKTNLRLASVHRFSIGKNIYNPNFFTKEIAQDIELDISLAGLEAGLFDVLGHPGGMSLKYFKEFPMNYFKEIIIASNKKEIAFELNSNYHLKIYSKLKTLLKKYNPLITFGSDAHNKINIGEWKDFLKEEFPNEEN